MCAAIPQEQVVGEFVRRELRRIAYEQGADAFEEGRCVLLDADVRLLADHRRETLHVADVLREVGEYVTGRREVLRAVGIGHQRLAQTRAADEIAAEF